MDAEEIRRHLGGADSTSGRGGPTASEAQMTALSVVSTEVGQLQERMEVLAKTVGRLEDGKEKQEDLVADVASLAETVAALSETVQEVLGQEEKEQPPPQPWDWAAMEAEEEMKAISELAAWVETVLIRWWPRVIAQGALPPCWMEHPDMLRDLSLVYVSYQQAYEHAQRRAHHEVDFRRALDDMLRDIKEAATAYRCWGEESKKPHVSEHRGRSDRLHTARYLRRRAAEKVIQAREKHPDLAARLVDQFGLSTEELRAEATRTWHRYATLLMDKRQSESGKKASAVKAASLLASYQAADPEDLTRAPAVEAVLVLLHQEQDPRFDQLRAFYGDLVRKYANIKDQHAAMAQPAPDEKTQRLMDRLGITRSDVQTVLNVLLK